jgi:hypothetical protein
MTRKIAPISLILLTTLTSFARGQTDEFIQVKGNTLKSGLDSALAAARSLKTPFWVAYSFVVRPGIAIDADVANPDGARSHYYGLVTSVDPRHETRNLGVFLLYEPGLPQIQRVELYNLARHRNYEKYPVYWLGHATVEESLDLLNPLVMSTQSSKIYDKAALALSVHDGSQAVSAIEEIARSAPMSQVRATAVFWLSKVPGEHSFISAIAGNPQENLEVRRQAAFALGHSQDKESIYSLRNLYESGGNRSLKMQIIDAASMNINRSEATNFLIEVATKEADPQLKKQAIHDLGRMEGDLSLEALVAIVDKSDATTDEQRQAVFSISQKPRRVATPILTRIAKTSPKPEVRSEATLLLNRMGVK